MNQVIQLDGILSNVQNDEVQVYSSNTIFQVSDQFDYAIDSVVIVAQSQLNFIVYPNNLINVESFGDAQLNQFFSVESVESTISFGDFTQVNMQIEDVPFPSIDSTILFGNSQLNFVVYPNSIESTVLFEQLQLNQFLPIESVESVIEFGIAKMVHTIFANETENQNQFDTPQLNFKFYPNSIESTVLFEQLQLNQFLPIESINPSALFGNLRTIMQIDDVPFPSIDSTVIVPVPNVLKVIGPLSIAPTASFGVASFIDNIHRILIFKDDNISKVGENDATVIAGGIRLNPSSVASETASSGNAILPEAPVGFLSINIDGNDYKIPYYNS